MREIMRMSFQAVVNITFLTGIMDFYYVNGIAIIR